MEHFLIINKNKKVYWFIGVFTNLCYNNFVQKVTKFAIIICFSLFCFLAISFSYNINSVFADYYITSFQLSEAIENAESGSTIEVSGGNISIRNTIIVDKSITLKFTGNANLTRFSQSFSNFFHITNVGNLIIDANGFSVLIDGGRTENDLNSNENFSIFKNEGNLTLKGITLQNNATQDGGGFYNLGVANLENCTLKNLCAINGGAFYNEGQLTFENCVIKNNFASSASAGISNTTLESTPKLTIINSTLENNGASSGGAISIIKGEVKILGGKFEGNIANNGANDLYIKKHLNPETDEISAEFLSQNQTSIVAEDGLVIGENFKIGKNSKIVLNQSLTPAGKIYIKSLPEQKNIFLEINNVADGQEVAEFLNSEDKTEDLFVVINNGFKLELLGSSLYAKETCDVCNITFKLKENNDILLERTISPGQVLPEDYFQASIANVSIPNGKHIVFKDKFDNIFEKDALIYNSLTIYVDFEINILKVKFYVEDVLQCEPLNIEYGKTISEKLEEIGSLIPAIETKEGYDLINPYWVKVGETEKFNFNETPVEENLSLQAYYVINTYQITFTLNYYKDSGKTIEFSQSQTITKNWHSQITEEDIPSFSAKEGYSGEIVWESYDELITENKEIFGSIQKDVLPINSNIDEVETNNLSENNAPETETQKISNTLLWVGLGIGSAIFVGLVVILFKFFNRKRISKNITNKNDNLFIGNRKK